MCKIAVDSECFPDAKLCRDCDLSKGPASKALHHIPCTEVIRVVLGDEGEEEARVDENYFLKP
jgi:hypothetical protein